MKINGLIAAVYAPTLKTGALNLQIIDEYATFLKENKIKGVFVNGSTGDFVSLSVEERKKLIEGWSNHRSDDFLVINHVGSTNIKEAKELANHCKNLADATAAIAPYYFSIRTIESLVDYCFEIASVSPQLPFYYYHLPAFSKANLNMNQFLNLVSTKIQNFNGIKYSHNDLIDFGHSLKHKNCDILFGYDEWFLNSLPMGTKGWVGSTYNHLAPLYNRILENFRKGNMIEAARLQNMAVQFVEILDEYGGFNGIGKSFMKELGLDLGPSRFPHKNLNNNQRKEINLKLINLGIKDYFPEGINVE